MMGTLSLDCEEIKAILPQRFPFLLLDRVVDLRPGESAVGIKNVTVNEPFFEGHFPSRAIMPGVLIAEAMAQTALIFWVKSNGVATAIKGPIYYLAGLKVRFLVPVRPGDRLEIRVVPRRLIARMGIVAAEASVDSRTVARGELVVAMESER